MRSSPSPRSFATSTSTPVTYCTWIRRNWPVSATWTPHPRRPLQAGLRRRLGERPRRYRRSLSGGVRRSAARRRPTHLHSVPAASRRALRFDGSSGAPSDDRQRAWLRLEALQSPMPSTRDPAHLHPALHPRTNGKAERFIRTLKEQWPTAPATRPQLDVLELYGPGSTTTIVTVPTPASA